MTHDRLFIAIELPSQIQLELAKVQRRLAPLQAVRRTHFRLIHLTLQFLGDTPTELMPQLSAALQQSVSAVPPFSLSLAKVGAFPNLKRPRIIWAGVNPNPALAKVYQAVIAATASIGIPPDKKPFNPHLTLGRVKKQARSNDYRDITATLSRANIGKIATFKVEHIALIRSELTRQGPIYTPVTKIRLQSLTPPAD